jgi:predicted nuclease of predicted toxin-antitoxin system
MAGLLRAVGHECAHVYELGLGGQPDEQIMDLADREHRILISADTDFGELLANAPVLAPSVILLSAALTSEPPPSPRSYSPTSNRSPTTWPPGR